MPGIEKLLKGILRYRINTRGKLLQQFQKVKDNPEPTAIFFTCIDSRVLATKFTDSQVGENLVVRSAGNLIPHACHFSYEMATTEAGALELGCIMNDSRDVVVCGHSDCKAMNLLHSIKDKVKTDGGGPLQMWLKRHGADSVRKFEKLLAHPEKPLKFRGGTERHSFEAHIDPENKLSMEDKLSQVNCLQQIQNIASYPFLKDKLSKDHVKLHAMWFDVYSGEVFMFSRSDKLFLQINEDNLENLLADAQRRKNS